MVRTVKSQITPVSQKAGWFDAEDTADKLEVKDQLLEYGGFPDGPELRRFLW